MQAACQGSVGIYCCNVDLNCNGTYSCHDEEQSFGGGEREVVSKDGSPEPWVIVTPAASHVRKNKLNRLAKAIDDKRCWQSRSTEISIDAGVCCVLNF